MAHRFGISGKISTFPSMVLGTSDVRLIDMTRAFAAVQNRGVSVVPYAIRKVVTADGQLLYQHQASEQRVLVAPWVAADMTDLLQIGGPVGHRPGGADRPSGRRQDRHHLVQQGRLVHRLFQRDHHRRVDGPRRRPAGRRAAGRHGAGARLRRVHEGGGGQAARSSSSRPRRRARLAAGARRGGLGLQLCRFGSRWSTPTAIRSAPQPADPLAPEAQPQPQPQGETDSSGSTRCCGAIPRTGRRRSAAADGSRRRRAAAQPSEPPPDPLQPRP